MKVTNLVFWVQENTISEKFYAKLGFDITKTSDDVSTVRLGDFWIDLVSMRDEPEFAADALGATKGLGAYLYVRVDDVDAVYRRLTGQKLTPSSQPRDWPWGNREFVIKDPDGYKICFWQPSITH